MRTARLWLESRYNLLMLRAALLTLLFASSLAGSLQAQRARGMSQGHAARVPAHSGFIGQRGISRRSHRHRGISNSGFRRHHDGFGDGFFPFLYADDEPFYEPTDTDETVSEQAPPLVIEDRGDGQPRRREEPRSRPLVIEIPEAANPTSAKTIPPTIFILTDGERLEGQRFLLTATNLSISIHSHERTIPFEMLDLDATAAANRERGIDLRIPADRNEILLRF